MKKERVVALGRVCNSCGIWKSSEFFSRKASHSTGLYNFCKECNSVKNRQHYLNNADVNRARSLEYGRVNKEAQRERSRRWYERVKGTDEFRAKKAIRKKNDQERYPERYNACRRKIESRRDARIRAGGKHSEKEFRQICERYGGLCVCCGGNSEVFRDHIVPVCKGGRNTIDNIQPLCRKCNSVKGVSVIDYRPDMSCLIGNGDKNED